MTKPRKQDVQLDSFDIKLLSALQENNQRTSEELASLVNLSPAACLRRVKRLRDTRVISADVSVVAPEALGQRMTMIVVVALERDQHDLTDAFMASMRSTPQVTQCYYVTGQADFVLVISVRDMNDYDAFTRSFFAENRNVKRFDTMVVMTRAKFEMGVKASTALAVA
jgi:Lrp/AsnC family transcriptional regulator, leucine-responsive regulatory protein